MRNFYRLTIGILICVTLLLSGCGSDAPLGDDVVAPVNKGTDGLTIGFTKNNPPKTVKKGDDFMVELEMRNRGSYDIDEGIVMLINGVPQYLDLPEARTYRFDLDGRKIGRTEGGYYINTFQARSTGLPSGSKQQEVYVKTRACYPYQTTASVNVCIDPGANEHGSESEGACSVQDTIIVKGGQGAPVAVTQIDNRVVRPNNVDVQMQFLIHIKNVDTGKVTKRESYGDECTGGSVAESDFVNIDPRVEISGTDITQNCRKPFMDSSGSKEILLFCTYNIEPTQGSFVTPLIVTLDYGYVTPDVKASVTVQRFGQALDDCEADYCAPRNFAHDECAPYGGLDETKECLAIADSCCMNPVN